MSKKDKPTIGLGTVLFYVALRQRHTVVKITDSNLWLNTGYKFSLTQMAQYLKDGRYKFASDEDPA